MYFNQGKNKIKAKILEFEKKEPKSLRNLKFKQFLHKNNKVLIF